MVTSGGYQRRTAEVIARSILNLRDKRLIENSSSAPWGVSAVGQKRRHLQLIWTNTAHQLSDRSAGACGWAKCVSAWSWWWPMLNVSEPKCCYCRWQWEWRRTSGIITSWRREWTVYHRHCHHHRFLCLLSPDSVGDGCPVRPVTWLEQFR